MSSFSSEKSEVATEPQSRKRTKAGSAGDSRSDWHTSPLLQDQAIGARIDQSSNNPKSEIVYRVTE